MMLNYVRESLGDDEEVIMVAQFHWMYSFGAILNILFGIAGAIILIIVAIKFQPTLLNQPMPYGQGWVAQVQAVHPVGKLAAFFLLIMGVFKFAQMMVTKAATEIAVTNKRLIYKRGLVARAAGEINIDRVEGTSVHQGFLGRILNYGVVIVRGMGVGAIQLPAIANPVLFRKAIERARNI